MSNQDIVAITGSAGALGSEVARHLSGLGYGVLLIDRSLERVQALAASLPGDARAIACDICDPSAWSVALAALEEPFRAPTHAVLAAGGWQGGAPLYEEQQSTWRAMIDANLETAHGTLRALLPGMAEQKRGSIVVIGSLVVERPWAASGAAGYAASKAAVITLAQAAAEEVRQAGVRINAVLPSTLDTPANRRAMPDADPARWVSLASAAHVIAFLLSDASRDVTGAALPLYGRA